MTITPGSAKVYSEQSLTGLPKQVKKEVQTMYCAKQVRQWIRSSAATIWQQSHPLMTKVASLPKKAKSWQALDLITPLGILIGAVAFGLWWQKFTAALFAAIVLFFLAGIYKTTERIFAAVRLLEGVPHFGQVDARILSDPTPKKSDALTEAIKCLKPWLANEASLTEENAKECCALLIDSIAARARPATSTISG